MTPEERAELFQKIKNEALGIKEEKPAKKKKSKKRKEVVEENVEILDLNELNK